MQLSILVHHGTRRDAGLERTPIFCFRNECTLLFATFNNVLGYRGCFGRVIPKVSYWPTDDFIFTIAPHIDERRVHFA